MTVSAGTIKHVYNGNGTTRDWDYTFPIYTADGSDIKLYKTAIGGAITEITSNYSVDVVAKHVTYPTVASGLPLLATGEKITLLRTETLSQDADWKNQGPFNAETVESVADKNIMIAQQQNEALSRAVKFPVDQTPSADDTDTFLSTIQADKAAAAASATEAANYAAALKATSTSSVAIGIGEKTFTTQSGKQFAAGQFILIVDTANFANYMHGQVVSYSGTTLVVDVQNTGGSGTIASWNIYVSGNRGAKGEQGGIPIATAGGTVDAITANYTPSISLTDLTLVAFVATGANTSTTPTFAPNGLTARTIVKKGGQPLVAGDIPGAGAVCLVEYNLANTRWELLNPANAGVKTDGSVNPTNLLSNGDFELWTAGVNVAPDGWVLIYGSETIARESTTKKLGSYSLKLTNALNAAGGCDQVIHTERGIDYWKGRKVTFGCWIYASVAGRVRLRLEDGVSYVSSYHSGDSTWQFIRVTHTINNNATSVTIRLWIDTGTQITAYFDGAIAVEGESAFAFTKEPPKLGAWATKSQETVYQAATDGFVVATFHIESTQGGGMNIKTDGASPPTVIRVWLNLAGVSNAQYATGTCPVKKGDYWKVEFGGGGGTLVVDSVYWIPLGS